MSNGCQCILCRPQHADATERAIEQVNAIRNAELGMYQNALRAADARLSSLQKENHALKEELARAVETARMGTSPYRTDEPNG